MLNKLKNILELNQIHSKDGILVACSGGPDSVLLLIFLKSLGYSIQVAHCNFQLRGQESDLDEEFVSNLCQKEGIPFHVIQFETENIAKQRKESIQLTARNLRYQWFSELAEKNNLKYICTAHHLDDRIETFFLNLFRGTGLNGLAPLEIIKGNRLRPFNSFTKSEILDYLESNGIAYRLDQSNESTKYERNKIRLDFLPEMEKLFPEYRQRFQENFDRLEIVKTGLELKKQEFLDRYLIQDKNQFAIRIEHLTTDLEVLWLLEYFDGKYNQLSEIQKLIQSQKGKHIDIEDFRFTREENSISISNKKENSISLTIHEIPYEDQYVKISLERKVESFESNTIYLDFDKVIFPLSIQNWMPGDRLQPLGMKGKKLVSDYLTDRKIPSNSRSKTLVIKDKNSILGIIGHCCDEKFKIENKNANTLIIKLKEF
ncbi:MAG: tRNA lysidine(34) synthetase TilS [Crocinitomicaceae bacterium]|nr:tRNA lysidine(34) synthetase TilS [Crocinitomicaceae bacterium]